MKNLHTDRREKAEMDSPSEVLEQKLLEATRAMTITPKSLLDVGAGAAVLSDSARCYGIDYTGVEFDDLARRVAMAERGVALNASLEELEGQRFDLVYLSEVIEHVPEPVQLLEQLRHFLTPMGALYVTTPNAESFNARFRRANWHSFATPTHLGYFSRSSLRLALGTAGYSRVRELNTWLRFPHHALPRKAVHWSLTQLKLDGGIRFVAFDEPAS